MLRSPKDRAELYTRAVKLFSKGGDLSVLSLTTVLFRVKVGLTSEIILYNQP